MTIITEEKPTGAEGRGKKVDVSRAGLAFGFAVFVVATAASAQQRPAVAHTEKPAKTQQFRLDSHTENPGFFPIDVLSIPAREAKSTFKDMLTCHDVTFCAAAWSYVGAYSMDMASTEVCFNQDDRKVEVGPFSNGTRSMGKIALAWGAVTVANIVVSHA